MKSLLTIFFCVSFLTLSAQSSMPRLKNQMYSDVQFMLMPSIFSSNLIPMMTMIRWDVGYQKNNLIGLGVGAGLDGIKLPDYEVLSFSLGVHYKLWANGVMYKPEIGLANLSYFNNGQLWEVEKFKYGHYFRQEVSIQFTRVMTTGLSLMVLPKSNALLSPGFDREIRSFTYVMLHFGFILFKKVNKN